jgi:hypothetical protein
MIRNYGKCDMVNKMLRVKIAESVFDYLACVHYTSFAYKSCFRSNVPHFIPRLCGRLVFKQTQAIHPNSGRHLFDKTKEMLVCSANRVCVERLKINDIIIQCVPSFKLLGVSIDCNLKWNSHVESICSKANCRIYFLKHLKRSGVELEDLLLFYYTAIRSILEYACPAWHTSITSEQSDRIETIQKRALSIIFNFSVFENYGNFCAHNGIESLAKRRDDLCRKFFDRNVLNDFSCLHYLLPTSKDEHITNKLRNRPKYNNLTARTARFMNSLIMYGLSNYL